MSKWTLPILAVMLALVCQTFVATPSNGATWACPGAPICGQTCSLDPFGVPIYCSNGQCTCPPGYETEAGPPIVCQPRQPEFMPSSSDEVDCSENCTSTVWGLVGSIFNAFDLVPVHGTAPGGEAFMPVWGYQANFCGVHGVASFDSNGNPIRTWATCAPDPYPFCNGIQDSDEADFNPTSCDNSEGCGDDVCTSDFTIAWPYLDTSVECQVGGGVHLIHGVHDPSRIDFPNNVSVYRAPIAWENHSDEGLDDDYTMNLHSPGHELYDTNTEFEYQGDHGRVHVEYDSDESIDHFTDECDSIVPPVGGDHDWGIANQFWRDLRCHVDQSPGNDDQTDRDIRCFLKHFVNPNLTCPQPDGVEPVGPDVTAVVVGVPSLDCADNPHSGTDEIHPADAVALRLQEDPNSPEEWAFFYRRRGDNGACGTKIYGRCSSTYQLPLAMPNIPAGKILKSADVQVDWHGWSVDDSTPSDVSVAGHFDLANGTVLTITLPGGDEGVVGHVTVTPVFDTTPPQIACPANIVIPPDLGKCSAVATFAPVVTDDCSASAVCSVPSGSTFPLGTTTDTCTATDQAGQSTSCSFNVTVSAGNKCPRGDGYWKNNTNQWAVDSLTLGNVTYTKAQLINILSGPVKGDASVILAKQLITAFLNLANGSSPAPVCNLIADANSALGSCSLPCGIKPNTAAGQTMIDVANNLQMYNNGQLTPGCTP